MDIAKKSYFICYELVVFCFWICTVLCNKLDAGISGTNLSHEPQEYWLVLGIAMGFGVVVDAISRLGIGLVDAKNRQYQKVTGTYDLDLPANCRGFFYSIAVSGFGDAGNDLFVICDWFFDDAQ